MASTLSLSKSDYPSLNSLLTGQKVTLKVTGEVVDSNDGAVSISVKSISVSSKSKLSTNEIVQQLAATREKTAGVETHA